ncbi:MAG: acyl carrier protein [Pseudomonadales bacterium]
MTDFETYRAFIIEILQPFAKQGTKVNDDTQLVAELGLSSLQVMELIEQIEDHFDISVPLNMLPDMNTAQEMAQRLAELAAS